MAGLSLRSRLGPRPRHSACRRPASEAPTRRGLGSTFRLTLRLVELNLLEARLGEAIVAIGVIEDGAERPLLLGDGPFRPGIARDPVPAAGPADDFNRHEWASAHRP